MLIILKLFSVPPIKIDVIRNGNILASVVAHKVSKSYNPTVAKERRAFNQYKNLNRLILSKCF